LTNLLVGTPRTWEELDNTIHIYDPRITSRASFLEHRFQQFRVRERATQFRDLLVDWLGCESNASSDGTGPAGCAGADPFWSSLDPGRCKPEEKYNVTARQLLLGEAAGARFVTILTYPDAKQTMGKTAWDLSRKTGFGAQLIAPHAQLPLVRHEEFHWTGDRRARVQAGYGGINRPLGFRASDPK
jgi:hypothetical protein